MLDMYLVSMEKEAAQVERHNKAYMAAIEAKQAIERQTKDGQLTDHRLRCLENWRYNLEDDTTTMRVTRSQWQLQEVRIANLSKRVDLLMKLLKEARREPNDEETFELLAWDDADIWAEQEVFAALDG